MPFIKDDRLDVFSFDVDRVGGAKPEPEQQPAQRTLAVDMPATGSADGQKLGEFNGSVAVEMPAIQVADGASRPCLLCKHFDNKGWLKLKRVMDSTAEGMRYLSAFRHELMISGNAAMQSMSPDSEGEGVDAEHALNSLGLCRIMTEIANSPRVVYPVATCPEKVTDESGKPQFPMPMSWEPRTAESQKIQSEVYDSVMLKAQGKWRP